MRVLILQVSHIQPGVIHAIHRLHHLGSTGLLQQARELLFLRLQVRVSANVLLLDEDVWHGALAGDAFKGVLHCSTIVCIRDKSACAAGDRDEVGREGIV